MLHTIAALAFFAPVALAAAIALATLGRPQPHRLLLPVVRAVALTATAACLAAAALHLGAS